MNAALRHALVRIAGATLGLTAATAGLANPVGGDVDPINELSSLSYITNIDIVGANGLGSTVVVSGTINNNDEHGWDLTVTSANLGVLRRGSGGAGRELAYTNIQLANTGGTLGSGLTSPAATRNIATGANAGDVAGTTHFFTHSAYTGSGTATSATVNYTFELRITASADTSILSGSYSDDITLTLNNDS
jgi:hypothetical protein